MQLEIDSGIKVPVGSWGTEKMPGPWTLNAALYAASLAESLKQMGYEVSEHRDFKSFTQACNDVEGKKGISQPLNYKFVDIDPADLLWLQLLKGDRLIAVQGLKRERVTCKLSEHLDQQYRRIHCDPDVEDCGIRDHAPGAHLLTGDLVYHGDLFIVKNQRGNGLAKVFSRLALALAYLRWHPDYIWGFIYEELVETGYAQKLGYCHSQPVGTHWEPGPPTGIGKYDWFVWSSGDDISYICECAADRLRKVQDMSHS